MRRLALLLALPCLLAAQDAAQQPAEAATQAAPAAAEAAEAAEAPESPVSDREASLILDLGSRFIHNVTGDFPTYRSVVNLGEGLKLFNFDAAVSNPNGKLFDKLDASAGGWGGDPYNTIRLRMERQRLYRLTADYRNSNYYNFLPSFANPFLETGGTTQRSFDLNRRFLNVELEFLPTSALTPYIAYMRNSGEGTGVTPFVATRVEYPVRSNLTDSTDLFRGGIRYAHRWFHLTLEAGGSNFKDDQLNTYDGPPTNGSLQTPILGQQLFLSDLYQAYGIRGKNVYAQGTLTAAPAPWLDLNLQFQHSRPTSDLHYSDNAAGLFLLGATRFFNGLDSALEGTAKMPRTAASFGAEIRILPRLRLVENWSTDRFHNASSALLAEQLLFSNAPPENVDLLALSRLVLDHNRQEANLIFDLTNRITLRGGHRYVYGHATVPPHFLTPNTPNMGELRQHVALAGFSWRPSSNISANIDYEGSPGDRQYFRTSLSNYDRLRARARWQLFPSLLFSAAFSYLDNHNPQGGSDFQFESRALSGSVEWRPWEARRIAILGDYTRSSFYSDIQYLVPQNLQPARSLYRDNAHTATGLLDLKIPGSGALQPSIQLGGSLFVATGTRPADYWQPLAKVFLPVHKSVQGFAEWRYYGLTQAFHLFEGFRTHQFVGGLRLTK